MKLLDLLAEALSAEKEKALRDKFVQQKDPNTPREMMPFEPNKISEKEFKALLDIDETPNGVYLNWIIPRYVKLDRTERKRFFDDGHNEQIKELLPFFDKNKQRLKKSNIEGYQADINLYKTLRDFENIIGAAKAQLSGGEEQEGLGPEKFSAGFIKPIQVLGKTPSGFVVYKVPQECKNNEGCFKKYQDLTGCGDPTQNFEPSKEGGEAPRSGYRVTWCTRNTGMFNSYLTNGPYYLFKNWDTRRQYQLHYESGQLKDEADREINGYNNKAQNEFLQFLLDKEGRIPSKSMSFNLDLSKFKLGDEEGFPIYKIGPMYYIDAKSGEDQRNNLVYYDSSVGTMKNVDGQNASTLMALKYPYNNLVKFLHNKGIITKDTILSDENKKEIESLKQQIASNPSQATELKKKAQEIMKPFAKWQEIRILSNLDIPAEVPKTLNGNVLIPGTAISSLPDNLTINGDFDISNTKLKQLPKNLKVNGILNVKGTGIKVPPGVAQKVIQD